MALHRVQKSEIWHFTVQGDLKYYKFGNGILIIKKLKFEICLSTWITFFFEISSLHLDREVKESYTVRTVFLPQVRNCNHLHQHPLQVHNHHCAQQRLQSHNTTTSNNYLKMQTPFFLLLKPICARLKNLNTLNWVPTFGRGSSKNPIPKITTNTIMAEIKPAI